MPELRPYQIEARQAIENEWASGVKNTLLVLPTGTGKTVVFSKVIEDQVRAGDRCLILAHRGELLDQAADKLKNISGLGCSVEKADQTCLGEWFRVVVGSVQTLQRPQRLERFKPDYFNTIIIDEAHHAITDGYRRIIDYFPDAKVLGVTATPDRGDQRKLGEVFQSLAYEYSIVRAIKEGYLCRIMAQTIPIQLDMTSLKTQAGDYTLGSIDSALDPYLEQIATEMETYCKDRKTVVFLPLIKTSQKFRQMLENHGFRAAEVNGESTNREEVLKDFEEGKYDVICNSMLLCLDTETEILTSRGFLGVNDLTMDDEVANWNFDGTVFFEKPKDIIVRGLEPIEHMVSVDTGRHNFRVTNTHRMIVGCGIGHRDWKKKAANELTCRDVLPACGVAEPMQMQVQQEDRSHTKHAINNCVYHLTQKGWDREEARKEAERRAEHDATLRYKNPEELTTDECKFIGFWIADGSRTNLQSGGVEYSLAQSERYGNICKWVDEVVESCGFDCIKRRIKPDKKSNFHSLKWSLPRGTGKGCQQKNGVYSIEPYLNKDGVCYFWGLNERQFDALLKGFWYGDGFHGDAQDGMPPNITMTNTNRGLLELFCAIGAVRGWKCSISFIKMKNEKHRDQYRLNMAKHGKIVLSEKTQISHEAFSPETVWCVRTTSKNIITRRHGRVTVMGNTEGWDCPSVDCIVVLRPTKIRSLYCLDTETEVLTHSGWKTDVEVGEEVAAFDKETGEIRFVPALAKVRRPLDTDEHFCSLEGQSSSIRVTNKHRMIYDNKRHKGWKVKTAEEIADMKDGCTLPVSGHGMFKGVPLSDDELRFIGWVMTDGSINKSNNAITITQEKHQPWLETIQECIDGCGLKYNRFERYIDSGYKRTSPAVIWTISKGKPRGRDKDKRGWGYLEPYLSKDLSPLLFDMTEHQFDVMLEAINLGDGHKPHTRGWTQRSFHIRKGNKTFIERLQIMAIQRGYRASVCMDSKTNKSPIYGIHLKKQTFIKVGSTYGGHSVWQKETYKPEECWCVENELGTLVTRHHGKVAIVGNCQMVGRGTRLYPGKKELLLLDFLWLSQKHELCRPADIICKKKEVSEKMTENLSALEEPVDIMDAELQAEKDVMKEREEALQKALQAEQHRKRSLVDPLQFEMSIQSEDLATYEPPIGWQMGPASEKQLQALEKFGIFPDTVDNAGKASLLLDKLMKRRQEGLSTPKQIRYLESRGFQHVGTWTFEDASKMMSRISMNNWRIPPGVDPITYAPEA